MFALLASLLFTQKALAWGDKGHSMVGKIATEFLTEESKALLKEIIPEEKGDLGDVANWADEIKNKKLFGEQWSWASELHYVSVLAMPKKDCNYDDDRDCKSGRCIVGAIQNYTTQAMCVGTTRPNPVQQQVAVKFLTHFIGDISMPLHNCNRSRGGNDVLVKFDGRTINGINRPMNLHGMWDYEIVDKTVAKFYGNSTALMVEALVKDIKSGRYQKDASNWISKHSITERTPNGNSMVAIDWTKDANGWNCPKVWGPVDEDPAQDFGGKYFDDVTIVVQMQIAKAGYRLAHHMNKILETCAKTTAVAVTSSAIAGATTSPSPVTESGASPSPSEPTQVSDTTEPDTPENPGKAYPSDEPEAEKGGYENKPEDYTPVMASATSYSVAGLLALLILF